jgi:large subunit ribosomal protein L25
MQQETLHATKRVTSGSRASKRLRRDGRVPGVVYGSDIGSQPVHVSARDLYAVLHTEAGLNAIIEIDVEGDNVLTVARELQRHPVRGDIQHLDFIEVRMDQAIQAEVGVEYTGTPIGVRDEGGIVETIEASVTISALPTAIPSQIEVDIAHLSLGDTLKVSDLPEIDGVTYSADADDPLLTVVAPAAEIVEEPLDMLEGDEIDGEGGAEADDADGDGSDDSEG